MIYVTYQRFYEDLAAWERKLPDYDAFVGVPRCGVLAAAGLASRRNVRLVELWQLLQYGAAALTLPTLNSTSHLVRRPAGNRVLIVDDTAGPTAGTFGRVKERLARLGNTGLRIDYGILYRGFAGTQVDHYGFALPSFPVYEFDWFRRQYVGQMLFDLDGVICEDFIPGPTGQEVDYSDEPDPDMLRAFRDVRPLYIPTWTVGGIVTGRLEKYRDVTEKWLAANHVTYNFLQMYPAARVATRQQAGDVWQRKAEAYRSSRTWCFVESDPQQSAKIATYARKPVLCPPINAVLRT